MTGLVGIVVGIVLLVLNGFFVAAEFALLSARRSRMEQLATEGDRRAVSAVKGLRELSLTLAGAQLGITMASLGLGVVAEPLVAGFFEHLLAEQTPLPEPVAIGLGFGIGLSIVVFLHMVVGEMAPKSWAIADPEKSSLLLSRPFRVFITILRPVIVALNAIANGVVRAVGVEPREELAVAHAPGDLLLVLRESARDGTIGGEDTDLLTRALDLSGLDAESVMVPRTDIVSVSVDTPRPDVLALARQTGRSRLPVHNGNLDQVVGVLTVKDALLDEDAAASLGVRHLVRPALVVPDSRPIEDLLLDMRSGRQHIAMVVDEYGSVSGLVALEDIVEELIGEFEDETDRLSRRLRRRTPDEQMIVSGSLRPHELTDRTGLTLPDGPFETLAGFIEHRTGAVGAVGQTVTHQGMVLEVSKVAGYRVEEVRIKPSGSVVSVSTSGSTGRPGGHSR
ncbi:hemolysin family protein [Euzebya tangerina]|uniref:hemolysin family protein n=1 Tax=Euzebya tangerina TaxID=591198 RepID=UPI000E32246D|nr:hemolysin family protein [Euzebya tangerina]